MKNMTANIMLEDTPLTDADCLSVFVRVKEEFNFPLHIHNEFELNFILNAQGAQRIVGDSVEIIDDMELTFITGSSLEHAWQTHQCTTKEIKEITIQFHPDIIGDNLLRKNSFQHINKLLSDAKLGVTFGRETIKAIQPKIEYLAEKSTGFDAVLTLLDILHELSMSPNIRILASRSFSTQTIDSRSRRIDKVYAFIEKNYQQTINLIDVAELVGMSEVGFCRFFKQRTGKTFIESLNETRLAHATSLLINTTQTVSEICFASGYNNLSNFNRLFLKRKKCTPSELREKYTKNRIVI